MHLIGIVGTMQWLELTFMGLKPKKLKIDFFFRFEEEEKMRKYQQAQRQRGLEKVLLTTFVIGCTPNWHMNGLRKLKNIICIKVFLFLVSCVSLVPLVRPLTAKHKPLVRTQFEALCDVLLQHTVLERDVVICVVI